MKNQSAVGVKTTNLTKSFMYLSAVFMALTFFLLPESALATATTNPAEAGATKIMEYVVKFLVWTGYLLIGITFFIVAWLVIKSLLDWKNERSDATVGTILLTIFVGIGAMAVLFYLVTEGQAYLEENVKFASLAKEVLTTLV